VNRWHALQVSTALAGIAILALIAAGLSGVVLAYGGRRVASAALRVRDRRRELTAAVEAQRALVVEENRARQIADRLSHLKESQRSSDYNAEFAHEIARAADASGSRMVQVQVASTEAGLESLLTSLTRARGAGAGAPANPESAANHANGARLIDVTVRGTFQSVVRFVDNLYRFPRIVAIEELRLQAEARRGAAPASLVMKLRLSALPITPAVPGDKADNSRRGT